jgi:hypothetical protein
VVATLAALILPAGLLAVTWLASRTIPVQQRSYMATAALLAVLGAATGANRWVAGLVGGGARGDRRPCRLEAAHRLTWLA